MNNATPHLDRFLSAAHRRFILARGLERLGVCLLIGCAAAGVISAVLLGRGQSAMTVAGGMLAISFICGLGLAAALAPKRLATAMEVDRQLHLADLLSSACVLEQGARRGDPWEQSVLAMADARCRTLRASTVVFRRWGSRAWGGVGLAMAAVVTLALFSATTSPIQAAPASEALFQRPGRSRTPQALEFSTAENQTRLAHRVRDPDAPTEPGKMSDMSLTGANPETAKTSANESSGDRSHNGHGATGSGSAQSSDHQLHILPGNEVSTNSSQHPSASPHSVPASSGGQTGTGSLTTEGQQTAGVVTAGGTAQDGSAAVWPSASISAADRQVAAQVLEGGRVPGQYHDMVRDYFQATDRADGGAERQAAP